MTLASYEAVLSDRTKAILELNRQKQELEAREARKLELIGAIEQASQLIDAADSDAQTIQADIQAKQRELDAIEKSLTKEQQKVAKDAEAIQKRFLEKAQKFNRLIDEAESIWKELGAEISQTEAITFRVCYGVNNPINLGQVFDFKFSDLPLFGKHDNSPQINAVTRYQGHPNAL
ncbi:hypothetical protein H6F51_21380 [Cyanobacteria bacterium FACHB-DQ100]|nr:hypothetical protein [Cyanobacteria bacterium FACHB-DQ100]